MAKYRIVKSTCLCRNHVINTIGGQKDESVARFFWIPAIAGMRSDKCG
jgi:hypothetical protein